MPETLDLQVRGATVAPTSIDDKARTVEVIWSTGARVARRDFDGPFIEELSLDPAHVNLDQLRGASVLDSHQVRALQNVLGVVERAAVDGKSGTATLRFSARGDVEPYWQDVKAGVIRHVSVGYTVETWQDATDPDTGERTRKAIAWTPREISLVPVPADAGAAIRSHIGGTMPEPTPTPEPAPAPAIQNRAAVNAQIRSIATIAGLDQQFIDGQIDAEASADQARAAAFAELERRGGGPIRTEQPRIQVGHSYDDPATRAAWIGEALYARVNPAHEVSDPARQYAGLSMVEIGREMLRMRGVNVAGLSPATVVTRSLHTTSDFSITLGDTVGRTLRAAYQSAPAGIKRLARQTTVRDFRAKTRIMLGEAPTLQKVNEAGEFTSGTMAEAKESYQAETFGRIIGISRQAIINDDLGAFSDLSSRFGVAAANFEAQFLVDLLEQNAGNGPTMDDGTVLFHADHANKAASGGSPIFANLSDARLAMRKQTGISGEKIAVTPKNVLVPADLETAAEQQLANIQAATTSDVNPFTNLMLVVEPRLSSTTRWYVTAEDVDGLEYCYLEGAAGPQTESRNGFEIDGVQVKVRLDFGAGFVDWRGWYMNPGS